VPSKPSVHEREGGRHSATAPDTKGEGGVSDDQNVIP
jgi:hypothetical protein